MMKKRSICVALAIFASCPLASAQWIQTVVDGGTVTALAVRGAELFAGTSVSRRPPFQRYLFHSTDNGENWVVQTTTGASAVVVGDTDVFVGIGADVFVSTNHGTSWATVNTGLTGSLVRSLVLIGATLYAGLDGGVFVSTNRGTSWTRLGLENERVTSLAVVGTHLFAGTMSNGVFLSSDCGPCWVRVNSGLLDMTVRCLAADGEDIFAATNGGVFRSTNDGMNWAAANSGLTGNVSALAVRGTSVFAGGGGVFHSTNRGTSWQTVSAGLDTLYPDLWVCDIVLNDEYVFVGTSSDYAFVGTSSTCAVDGARHGVWRRPLSE
jgi:hypothetical protein